MKILYIGVHSHTGWGAEYWLADAFTRLGHTVITCDYRKERKRFKPWWMMGLALKKLERQTRPDIILLQRADRMPPSVLKHLRTPIVFWSTEPIQLKNDVDKLLASDRFAWLYVHTYSCLDRIKAEFPHHLSHCSVIHNACPKNLVGSNPAPGSRSRFAIFNRNLSPRRQQWLQPAGDLITRIQGQFGKVYFDDLADSEVAVNIHFSDQNLDDFESGIFEALAKGCVVVSERLHPQTVADLGMQEVLIQVESPQELAGVLHVLKNDESMKDKLRSFGATAIAYNTWDDRARQLLDNFDSILNHRGSP